MLFFLGLGNLTLDDLFQVHFFFQIICKFYISLFTTAEKYFIV